MYQLWSHNREEKGGDHTYIWVVLWIERGRHIGWL